MRPAAGPAIDPVVTAVIASRIDGIVREMTNTLLRAARSAVISSARDFSCGICTGDNQLLACVEGLPIHIFGVHEQARAMTLAHPTLSEGDAFLHNDPYTGNTHPADHTFLVPVFVDGEHLFTTVAKAHQADIGNSIPSTYHAGAADVYQEGALIFPSVRIQRDYRMIEDVVRMARSRIRVPGQWYGDFLAGLGAARIGERRLKELCAKFGTDTIKRFVVDWLDYSEQRMATALRRLPAARLVNSGRHDPFMPMLPDGIALHVDIDIDPQEARVTVDLRDNPDNVEAGLNLSEACTTSAVLTGVFNSLDPGIPKNSGSFRRVEVLMRTGSVVGRPRFPHSCSLATTNVADRLVNCTGAAFAQLGDSHGIAEGGLGMGVAFAVISGKDHRAGDDAYINQLIIANNGGPASPQADGWPNYGLPVDSGVVFRDSVEIDELKHPIEFRHLRLIPGSGGAGRFRGAPGGDVAFGPKEHPITVIYPCDGQHVPPRGVRGGQDGQLAEGWRISANGHTEKLDNVVQIEIAKGETIRGIDCSGGGYGDPLTRDPRRVLHDVLERWETSDRARTIYGVVLTGSIETETLAVDGEATLRLRRELQAARPS
ncbi:N-methylhydantoinase B [Enhydrobacter aerosaccus]|uniref:N-methylhydantoinase B n=1 Tax=Enhydrobacter aerosaccus TaxID=225324 RepID=A0A1T4JKT9_9HYPH|nr:hydantoinase B/oxoprolinase family protein [Enhydrobacter aerosaccus]SJZ30820.1 N-methylhydantoinase B [Enhydrobacter aerosaccus]